MNDAAVLGLVRLPRLEAIVPRSVRQAMELGATSRNAAFIAGGTNLVPQIRSSVRSVKTLVDLSGLQELRYIKHQGEQTKVGALTTFADMVSDRKLSQIPAFRALSAGYSSPAVMNLATVGGSIAIRQHTEDILPILLTLDGRVVLERRAGSRIATIEHYVGANGDAAGLVREVRFVKPGEPSHSYFEKLNIGISPIPIASVAVRLKLEDGSVISAVVAVGQAAGSTPGRVASVEKLLRGQKLSEAIIERARLVLQRGIAPLTDALAPTWYRSEVAGALFRRILTKVRRQS